MRIAVTGSKGQLGVALQKALAHDELLLMDLPEHDITDLSATLATLADFKPDVTIHGAAMTDVDGCERDPDLAYRVNVLGTRNIAVAAHRVGSAVAYISTDYVFDGLKPEPYREYDETNPLSVYARTKWIGEQVVRQMAPEHYIVRVAWLYGAGPRNFVRTVLRLGREQDTIHMVTDEVGSPTYAADAAQALARLIQQPAYGTYQLPNAGVCSRYEWAQEILRLTGNTRVELVPTQNYQRAARVPKRVEMINFFGAELGIVMRPWQEALVEYLETGEAHG
ncbi:MAG TPA: dTDP-4-dehydrorhamnose reductase [Chloroflexi bacterium]|jgi:dTDP-4-dehydrorhamnose reductase|nr:dTDP-4-dehydrorhamnose reductase [Chloroflexota bacterium]